MSGTNENLYITEQAATDPRPATPDVTKLMNGITPEQWAKFAAAVKEAVERINEILRKCVEAFKRWWWRVACRMNEYIEAQMFHANDRPRWWHLYKHAKKYRTRKKYRHLLMKQLLRKRAAERRATA